MKTATIRIYEMFGCSGRLAADVMHRGRVLKSFDRSNILGFETPERRGLADLCKAWAVCHGFTHYKFKG